MKVGSLMQLNRSSVIFIVLCLLIVLYVCAYIFIKKVNDVVFQEPVIFENADRVEKIMQHALEFKGREKKQRERQKEGRLSVVYFWKPYCPCNFGVGPHYADLVETYGGKDVDFYIVDLSESGAIKQGPEGVLLSQDVAQSLAPYVQYSPAIAIFNTDNTLLYYGPHSLGFVCNADTSIASQVIQSFKQGIFSKNINVLGEGCFCRNL